MRGRRAPAKLGEKTSYPEGKAVQMSRGESSSEGVMVVSAGRQVWEEAEEAGKNARQPGAPQALGRANPLGVLGPAKER